MKISRTSLPTIIFHASITNARHQQQKHLWHEFYYKNGTKQQQYLFSMRSD